MVASRPETEWDDDERGLMLALAEVEAGECPGCRGDLEETTAKESDGRYVVEPPARCHKCTALAVAQDKLTNPPKGRAATPNPHALLWHAGLKRPSGAATRRRGH